MYLRTTTIVRRCNRPEEDMMPALRKVAVATLVTAVLAAPLVALADQGEIDPAYGAAGTVDFTGAAGEPLSVVSVHVEDDGSALVVGSHEGNSTEQYLWAGRVNPNGNTVTNLAVTAGLQPAFSEGAAARVDGSGNTVIVGNRGGVGGSDGDMFVVRLNPADVLDTSFSGDGSIVIDTGNADWATSMLVEDDGSVVVAGFTNATDPSSVRMARVTPSGSLDASFGPLGIVTIPWTDAGDTPRGVVDVDLARGTGGNYLLTVLGTDPGSYIGTMVVDGNGDPVSTNLSWQNVADTTRIDTIQRSDGKVVVAAHVFDALARNESIALFRFNQDGTDDVTFGAGTLPVQHVIDSEAVGTRAALTETRTGELIVAYDVLTTRYGSRLQAFTEDGTPYTAWGAGGTLDVYGNDLLVSRDLGRQPNGQLLLLSWDLFDLKATLGPGSVTRIDGDDSGRFVDDDGNTHEANIEALAAAAITSGCDASDPNRFCPSDSVTRGQMATFIVRAAGLPPAPDTGPFTDTAGSPHAANIAAIEAVGVTEGCSTTNPALFCPNDSVTRGQMATFLVRAFDLAARFPATNTNPFADDNGNTHEANIAVLYATGVTTGCDSGDLTRYCPINPVTRAQMATFLIRTIGLP
ncbi:MAG: hypothetical protein OEM97_09430 [Acidimicrobiia bacterium]|nr:hypothetical protein [Acidimicrobiia bacterium]